MRKKLTMIAGTAFATFVATASFAASGEELFKKHCAVCHPDGGNIINPKKTLQKKDLNQNGLKTWQALVKNMRSPGPGMTKFDKKTVSDSDAKSIAEYILKTFK